MYTPSEKEIHRIANDFTYHPPIAELNQLARYAAIRLRLHDMAQFLLCMCPPSRELSLALTNLEQTMFWANASIARNEKAPAEGGK